MYPLKKRKSIIIKLIKFNDNENRSPIKFIVYILNNTTVYVFFQGFLII